MRSRPPRFGEDERGIAVVEFALLLPLLLTVAFGSYEVFRLVQASLRVRAVAQTIADLVAQKDAVTTAIMSDICTGGTLVMAPFAGSGLKAAVASVTYSASKSKRVQDWQDTTCGTATAMAEATAIGLATTDTPGAGASAIVVTVSYTYTAAVSYLFATTTALTAISIARPRNNASVTHG